GPYESTAIVTGPMPRNQKATRPKAKTAGASVRALARRGNVVLTPYATAIRNMIVMPSQYALKLPAAKPERMLSDAPPCRDDVTTSRVCAEATDVNTFTNSGMIAPASGPQEMILDSFHHIDGSPPRRAIRRYDTRHVS